MELPEKFENYFDFVLIDPPFITLEVWSKYAATTKHIIQKDDEGKITGKILCCSIVENDKMLDELLGLSACMYKPSIPNLIYQYNFYSNYEDEILGSVNEEIG